VPAGRSAFHRWLSIAFLATLAGLTLAARAQTGNANEWTWMGGSNTAGSTGYVPGVYGMLGVPSPENIPSGRVETMTWTDKNGNLWLFGGFSTDGTHLYFFNDLWKFNPANNEWAWMSGSNAPPCSIIQSNLTCGQSGVYGTQGTAAAANVPGGRDSAAAWTDSSGHLWLFGGDGFDSAGQVADLNDLWELDPSTNLWTWQGGSSTAPGTGLGDAGVFGTQGVLSASNHPGGLFYASVWQDQDNRAWLFGGWGFDANGLNGLPNNLWQFDSSTVEWAWMDGSSNFSGLWIQPSVYGTPGTPAPDNIPGSRWNGASWTDENDNLWLFGGGGYDSKGNSGYLNEMWEYIPSTQEWAWISGNSVMNCLPGGENQNCGIGGVYGTLGQPAPRKHARRTHGNNILENPGRQLLALWWRRLQRPGQLRHSE
jgi:N-acetylneuraminic acid mutarotase